MAAIAFHPRAATKGHKGKPDYALTRELVERVEVPVIVSGGLASAEAARRAYEESGADAVMIARGSLGNPWVFEELTGRRAEPPGRARDRRRVALGRSTGPRSTSAPSGRRATCASSTPGTWSAWRRPQEVADELQRSADLARARELIAGLADAYRGCLKRALIGRLATLAIIARLCARVWRCMAAASGRFFRSGSRFAAPHPSQSEVVQSESSGGHHPGGARETQRGDRVPLDDQTARGRGADQGGARIRRHLRERRIRRRQERTGAARGADRPARREAAPRHR